MAPLDFVKLDRFELIRELDRSVMEECSKLNGSHKRQRSRSAALFGRLFFGVVADSGAMERRESELDWTIVRPSRLTDKPIPAGISVRETHWPRFGFSISRAVWRTSWSRRPEIVRQSTRSSASSF
jgi:hypothetical protein